MSDFLIWLAAVTVGLIVILVTIELLARKSNQQPNKDRTN